MYHMVLKSPYKRAATWDVTSILAAEKAARAGASAGAEGTSPHCPLPRHYLWSICSPSRYRIGYVVLLPCSDSPTPTGGETGSIQLSDPLPAEALLCSGDLQRAMGRCNRFIATPSVSVQQPGVKGRSIKPAFLQQGKKPNLPSPVGLRCLLTQAGGKAQIGHFSGFCGAGLSRAVAQISRHGASGQLPHTELPRRDGGTSPGTRWLSPGAPAPAEGRDVYPLGTRCLVLPSHLGTQGRAAPPTSHPPPLGPAGARWP